MITSQNKKERKDKETCQDNMGWQHSSSILHWCFFHGWQQCDQTHSICYCPASTAWMEVSSWQCPLCRVFVLLLQHPSEWCEHWHLGSHLMFMFETQSTQLLHHRYCHYRDYQWPVFSCWLLWLLQRNTLHKISHSTLFIPGFIVSPVAEVKNLGVIFFQPLLSCIHQTHYSFFPTLRTSPHLALHFPTLLLRPISMLLLHPDLCCFLQGATKKTPVQASRVWCPLMCILLFSFCLSCCSNPYNGKNHSAKWREMECPSFR